MVIRSQHLRALRLQKLHEKMSPAVLTEQTMESFRRQAAEAVLQQMRLLVRPYLHIFTDESGLEGGDHSSALGGEIADARIADFSAVGEGLLTRMAALFSFF